MHIHIQYAHNYIHTRTHQMCPGLKRTQLAAFGLCLSGVSIRAAARLPPLPRPDLRRLQGGLKARSSGFGAASRDLKPTEPLWQATRRGMGLRQRQGRLARVWHVWPLQENRETTRLYCMAWQCAWQHDAFHTPLFHKTTISSK